MREKFEEILNNNGIYGEQVSDILNAVQEMLEYMAEDTREKYPSAVNSINGYEAAAQEICELIIDMNVE